jgi:broad specificity polyphosphatase/5'/3'-nucleotidase SurE
MPLFFFPLGNTQANKTNKPDFFRKEKEKNVCVCAHTHTHIRTHTENHKNTKSETTVYKQKTGNIFSTQTQQYDVKIFKKYR